MSVGFQRNRVRVLTSDGLDDVLLEPLDYQPIAGPMLRCPMGGTTDGVSTPRIVQNIIPASGNGSWMAGLLHDSIYRGQLLKWDDRKQNWVNANLTRFEADKLILEAMKLQGVGAIKRNTIYYALRLFGGRAWNNNRSPAGLIRNKVVTPYFIPPVNSHYDGVNF